MKKHKIINKRTFIIILGIGNAGFLGVILWLVKSLYEEFYQLLPYGFFLWAALFALIWLGLIYCLLRPKALKTKFTEQLVVFFGLGLITGAMLVLKQIPQTLNVIVPAPPFPVSATLDIEGGSDSYFLTGVYTKKQSSLLGKGFIMFDPYFDLLEETTPEDDNLDQIKGQIAKEASMEAAVLAAYQAAGMPLNAAFQGMIVYDLIKNASPSLQVGDIIIKINGQSFSDQKAFFALYDSVRENISQDNLKVTLTVIRDNIPVTKEAIFGEYQGSFALGLALYPKYQITDSTVASPKEHSSMGPSGGLMMSLAIYDALDSGLNGNEERITGTGTIDKDGNVGEIGGIKQKILSASLYGFRYFFVPAGGNNEKDALAMQKEINSSMQIVPVKTLQEAIDFMRGLNEKAN
ncbi:MAG TPA: hypothetical protein PKV63_07005 [Bacilli bacterium]|mgnify:CR=1 FL=1|nr:hypothetical protein [Bacilli bacterium]